MVFAPFSMTASPVYHDPPARVHEFANGLVLLAEPIPSMQSAAFTLMTPCGYSCEPADRLGFRGWCATWSSAARDVATAGR